MNTPAADPTPSLASRHEQQCRGWGLLAWLAATACLLSSLLLAAWPARLLWLSHAATLSLLSGILYAAAAQARWQRRRQGAAALPLSRFSLSAWLSNRHQHKASRPPRSRLQRWLPWPRLRRQIGRRTSWSVLCQAGGSLLALLLALASVQGDNASPSPDALLPAALAGLLGSFVCLWLERRLAQESANNWQDARLLQALLRASMLALLLPTLCGLGLLLQLNWLLRPLQLGAWWILLLSGELLLRSMLAAFRPHQRHLPSPAPYASLLAALLGPHDDKAGWRQQWQHGLGLELRQSWALQFLLSAMRPLAALLLLSGYLLSCVSIIPTEQRGIYQRFGAAVAVWQPGLHLGLPWPLGQVFRIENGQVHQLASGVQQQADGSWHTVADNAAGNNNRLWDGRHEAETVQLIASGQGSRQTSQLVGLDVQLVYRQGLRDTDALAIYRLADAPALLHSLAGQAMLHYFAGQQLDTLLGEGLSATARQLKQQIQQRLDQAGGGLELLAVVIQTIHPPAAAANAYHGVQAAEILAQANVARERGLAVRSRSSARQAAIQARAEASASAAEHIASSKAEATSFQADRQAYLSGKDAFLLERYLHNIANGLGKNQAIIIDHRIPAADLPTIDLRGTGSSTDPAPAIAGRRP